MEEEEAAPECTDAMGSEAAAGDVAETEEVVVASEAEYSWPLLRFDLPPRRLYHFAGQFRSAAAAASASAGNFLKGVKWSPDGSSFLTSCDDNSLRLFYLCVAPPLVFSCLVASLAVLKQCTELIFFFSLCFWDNEQAGGSVQYRGRAPC
jgi:hypothetical protein